MKVLFSPSKEMNIHNLIKKANDVNYDGFYDKIAFIKGISSCETIRVFKTKKDIYQLNQDINIYSKKAIDLYNGISFRQLTNLDSENYHNLMILSALYGFSYGDDYISPYRYDYTMRGSKKGYVKLVELINELLANEDIVYNLASNEFLSGICLKKTINFKIYLRDNDVLKQQSVASKKMRGQLANYIINNDNVDLKNFTYDGFYYDESLSTNNEMVYVKDIS
jgi:cytoplasmic iron level regulating protein YaaA (DUF328/UPF0246 family)